MRLLIPIVLLSASAYAPLQAGAQAATPAPIPATTYALLRAEHARGNDLRSIDAALASGDSVQQRLAVRAIGRFERAALEPKVIPLLTARAASVRREAINALGQMRSRYDLASLLSNEQDASVRAMVYETIGRVGRDGAAPGATAQRLAAGLRESDAAVRAGAARGMESLLRTTARTYQPSDTVRRVIRDVLLTEGGAETRQLLLLALTAANDRDAATVAVALRDTSAEVRRVAVALGRQWIDDTAPMVRWQALRVAGTCARAAAHVRDSSEHVALLAIDLLGELKCTDATSLAALDIESEAQRPWRHQAHAVVALAKVAPTRAPAIVQRLTTSTTWQARVYAAEAARLLKDSATLRTLALDTEPNVVIAAMTDPEQARRALTSTHAGLVLAAAKQLRGDAALKGALPQLLAAFDRFTAMQRVTMRDPRVALLERIAEVADTSTVTWLHQRLRDIDPVIAANAAKALSTLMSAPVQAITQEYLPPAFPGVEQLRGLDGATATMRIRGVGVVELALRFDDAPMAVHTFVSLASSGAFNGLTFHRIVPNFVIQGGSPGADEVDPITDAFMRDEVGLARNARGSFGISTRGRDTGDGQIYVNLVNNFRLDHDYTVFANVTRGLDIIDRVQEGDVIESIVVRRATTMPPAQPDTAALRGARQPTTSPSGALVFAHDGQLYLQRVSGGAVVRITSGSSWHRDPTFTADGSALVFASDSTGAYDLWRMPVHATASGGAEVGPMTRLTSHVAPETAPSVGPDGLIAFVRGSGGATRVWLRAADGTEKRLSSTEQTERAPRVSPDGKRIAMIVITEAGRRVIVRAIDGDAATSSPTSSPNSAPSIASNDATVESVAWSPDGRLAVSTRSGVYAVASDGSFSALVSKTHGDVDWSADGRYITIAEFTEVVVGYNGDPDRGLDRSATERWNTAMTASARGDALLRVLAPAAPDAGRTAPVTSVPDARAERNAAAFDRLWERLARTYFRGSDAATARAQWESVRALHRPRAIAATNDSILQQRLYDTQQARPALRADAKGRAAVSSAHPIATEAGLDIMRRGGNVIDAAVAVSFALGVVEPDASGIAGYGEMVIALKGRATPTVIEFMSRVPEEGGLTNTSLLVNGRYPSDGPVLVNVPGTVAGMHTAWQKYGSKKVPWADLLAPAIRAARSGYVVSQGLATTLATEREHFAKYEGSRALFFRNGQPLVTGDTIKNPDLAWVLEQIAAKGADGFYRGEVAAKWVADLRGKGNAMKLSDLARYFAPEREPISGTYRHYTIYSSTPPVSGGAELVARLNLLEQSPAPSRTNTRYTDDPASLHAALSAWFLVPSSRNRIADPAMWPIDVAPIVNKDTARLRWRCFDENNALTPASVRGDVLPCLPKSASVAPATPSTTADTATLAAGESPCGDEHAAEMTVCHAAGTTAFTVADNEGNAVSVTQTLGTWGGNFYVTPGLGFLSNDKLTSYGTDATQYGSRLPFARHGSTIAPTIAFKNGKPFFVVGAAGNAWITAAIYQTLLGALDYNLGPQAALELPRYLPGGGGTATGSAVPYTLQLEDGFSPAVITKLRALGYDINFVSLPGELREGYGSAVRIDGNVVTAGADPRRAGAAGAITGTKK